LTSYGSSNPPEAAPQGENQEAIAMKDDSIKTYGYRWLVLAAFMGINLTIQMLWICFAPVTGPAAAHYQVTDLRIGFLAMTFMIVYIPTSIPASWLIDRFGFQKAVGLGAILLGAFGLLRGFFSSDYTLTLAFTIGIALAQPLLLNAYTTLAAKWFPLRERATVSGLALAANFLGTTLGLMLTPALVARHGLDGMQKIYGVITALSALAFLILAREKPPTPASPPGLTDRALVLDGLRQVLRRKDFWICMYIFFVGVGIFNGIATWIENMVRPKGLNTSQAGMLGGFLLIGGIFGAFLIPMLSDKYRLRKSFILAGVAAAILPLLGFTFFSRYPLLLASVFLLGFFMLGPAPIGYQYAAEITFPAPEGTSNGLLVLAGQVSVVFIFGMEALNNKLGSFTPSLLLAAGMMLVNCALISRLHESRLVRN